MLQTGLNYSVSDYIVKATATSPEEKSKLESGGVLLGASYRKLFAPDFLGPFVFNTGYDFNTGFSKLTTDNTGGMEAGNGWYYLNRIDLSLNSSGWKQENVSLAYSFSSKRDHSPLENNMWQHLYRLNLTTRRVTNTIVRASANYSVQENTSGQVPSAYTAIQTGTVQQRRTFTYNLDADHRLSQYINLSAGASRGQSTSSTIYTLANISSVSAYTSSDEQLYGAATLSYPISRSLSFRAEAREEYQSSQTTESRRHRVNMNLDWQLRQISISLEYRFLEDMPDNGQRSQQQYYFARLSRPF